MGQYQYEDYKANSKHFGEIDITFNILDDYDNNCAQSQHKSFVQRIADFFVID